MLVFGEREKKKPEWVQLQEGVDPGVRDPGIGPCIAPGSPSLCLSFLLCEMETKGHIVLEN